MAAKAPAPLLYSEFLRQAVDADPPLLARLKQAGAPRAVPKLAAAPRGRSVDDKFMSALRRWRREQLALIAWRSLAGKATLAETLEQTSECADRALRSAHAAALQALRARYGTPRSASGVEQQLIIVAMGKLGGRELNFSSDIDLVFVYPEAGATDGKHSIDNEDFFTRLGQSIIRALSTVDADGFVFRVDMRLRPYGDSGALVCSGDALEEYLVTAGRDWERYAWVKARAVTGAAVYESLYANVIRPFVYRRYLDFGVFASLREMKALIEREVERRELHDNVKLGPGGIREIEFIVQSFQLVRGGQDRRLQSHSLLDTLPRLAGRRLLSAAAAEELRAAYEFLRRVENCLQMQADLQTHQLPEAAPARRALAVVLGYQGWAALRAELDRQRQTVQGHFNDVVFNTQVEDSESAAGATLPTGGWLSAENGDDGTRRRLAGWRADEGAAATEQIGELRQSALLRRLDATGRERLSRLLDAVLRELPEQALEARPPETLRRVLTLVEAIGPRSSYFSLLHEQKPARTRLLQLASRSEFVLQQLAAYPLLLDELLDARLLESLPGRDELASELQQLVERVDADDEERIIEQLRHFQRTAVFRIAVADLTGRIPVMQVSDHLTEVAELVLEAAMREVSRLIAPQLGHPRCGSGRQRRPVRLCAIGYGKLGGMELGYSSDLDLVFLHDSIGAKQQTDGGKPVDNQVYFVRFVQRLVNWLTMQSTAGRMYEVDMRLRPNGKGGMLVTSIEAFCEYQQREAWTWEHQALLHARAVAGDAALRERFDAVRMQIVTGSVHHDQLLDEVRDMRARMRSEKSQADATQFDLKNDGGGITDIEFLAQYWALHWAHDYPPVAMFADTIRQLESVGSADLVPQTDIDVLVNAYRAYRSLLHHRALAGLGNIVPAAEVPLAQHRAGVRAIWQRVFGDQGQRQMVSA
jgi:[glutamine synthetase] adenylyltransferase / [glutamine synthetase]-adenylyl-L-tyrosine phosphorylase